MKDVFTNKRLWIGIGCGILAVALIIGAVLLALSGDNHNNPNSTETTSNTGAVDTTKPGDVTDPGDTTNPGNVNDPTDIPEIPSDPAAPSDPVIEPTIPDEDPTLPTEPDGDPIFPTDADTGEIIPVGPSDLPSETFPSEDEHDFGGVTVGTIRATDWNSWDKAKRQAFLDSVDWWHITPEEYHNFEVATKYNDYDCGFEGHACRGQEGHDALMEYINAGCEHCGKHDCPSLLVVDPETLFTWPDSSKCPQYDITKDPFEYCQVCGKPHHGEPGTICVIYQYDGTCHYCGVWIKGETCHCCDPDDLD